MLLTINVVSQNYTLFMNTINQFQQIVKMVLLKSLMTLLSMVFWASKIHSNSLSQVT